MSFAPGHISDSKHFFCSIIAPLFKREVDDGWVGNGATWVVYTLGSTEMPRGAALSGPPSLLEPGIPYPPSKCFSCLLGFCFRLCVGRGFFYEKPMNSMIPTGWSCFPIWADDLWGPRVHTVPTSGPLKCQSPRVFRFRSLKKTQGLGISSKADSHCAPIPSQADIPHPVPCPLT